MDQVQCEIITLEWIFDFSVWWNTISRVCIYVFYVQRCGRVIIPHFISIYIHVQEMICEAGHT